MRRMQKRILIILVITLFSTSCSENDSATNDSTKASQVEAEDVMGEGFSAPENVSAMDGKLYEIVNLKSIFGEINSLLVLVTDRTSSDHVAWKRHWIKAQTLRNKHFDATAPFPSVSLPKLVNIRRPIDDRKLYYKFLVLENGIEFRAVCASLFEYESSDSSCDFGYYANFKDRKVYIEFSLNESQIHVESLIELEQAIKRQLGLSILEPAMPENVELE